jgi:hypothetical protein
LVFCRGMLWSCCAVPCRVRCAAADGPAAPDAHPAAAAAIPACRRWPLPPGGCDDLSESRDGARVAAVCGSTLYLLGTAAAGGAFVQLLGGACSSAFDDAGNLWVSRAAVSPGPLTLCSGVRLRLPPPPGCVLLASPPAHA